MKKFLLLLMAVISLFALVGCGSDKDEKGVSGDSQSRKIITGKIIEIKNNNTLLIQITKERGGYKVEDKVLIKYNEFKVHRAEEDMTTGTPAINDEVSTGFWSKDITKKDGYDYIEVNSVSKLINNN